MTVNSREAYRHYIFTAWKNNKNVVEIHTQLVNAWGQSAPSLVTVRRWIHHFKEGREDLNDNSRSGRPREAVTPQNVLKIQNAINERPNTTTQQLADHIGISKERVQYILHKELDLQKVTAKWIPHFLTEENKQRRVDCARELLVMLDQEFFNIIMGDET